MLVLLGLVGEEGAKLRFFPTTRPRTNILYTIRKNLLLGGSGASLLPPNKDSSFTCITRVNRSLVGKEGSEASLPHQDLYVPGKSLENSLLLYQALNEELVCWWELRSPTPTNNSL